MTLLQILREQRKFWIPLLVILLLNIAVFIGYRYVFFGKIREEWNRKSQLEERLAVLKENNSQLKERLEAQETALEKSASFYGLLDKKETRLTDLLAHLDDITRQAGLIPHAWSFGESDVEKFLPLSLFTISFPVEGSYSNVRKLLHFLELSDHFIVVNEISLSKSGNMSQDIRFSISVSTYFHTELSPAEEEKQRKRVRS